MSAGPRRWRILEVGPGDAYHGDLDLVGLEVEGDLHARGEFFSGLCTPTNPADARVFFFAFVRVEEVAKP